MEFTIKNIKKSMNDLMRTIGYQPAYFQNEGEFSIVRPVGRNDYPRFHLYIKEKIEETADVRPPAGGRTSAKTYIFSLHLDQKKTSYPARNASRHSDAGGEGWHAHSGEYDGEVVENEAERIKGVLGI